MEIRCKSDVEIGQGGERTGGHLEERSLTLRVKDGVPNALNVGDEDHSSVTLGVKVQVA